MHKQKHTDSDVSLLYVWEDSSIKNFYRVTIVAKELFKLYFGGDATRVWNYLNSGNIPNDFTANGRNVHASVSQNTGAFYLEVGHN